MIQRRKNLSIIQSPNATKRTKHSTRCENAITKTLNHSESNSQ